MKCIARTELFPALLLSLSAGLAGCQTAHSEHHATTSAGQEAYQDPSSTFAWSRPAQTTEAPPPAQAQAQPSQSKVHAAPEPVEKNSAMWIALPTGNKDTSALLLEKFAPREVVAGQPFDYDLRVTNLTGMSLSNVMVTDSLPPEFGFKSSDPKPQATGGPSGLTAWVLGTLDPHESRTIHLTGSASSAGSIGSCASATYATALCSTINVVQPALRLTASAPQESLLCNGYQVKLTVLNAGSGVARNVHISEPLPSGLQTADGKSVAEFTVPSLAAGESKELSFMAKATKPGLYAMTGTAVADGGLRTQASEVSTRVTQPVLAISNKGPERMFLGRPVTYEITVTNNGDAVATGTVLEDALPAGAKFASATDQGALGDGGVVRWTIGSLAPKDSRTVKVSLEYPGIGDFRTTATVRAVCAQNATAAAGTAMEGIPALLLDGYDDPDPVEVGQQVVYTLNVTNQGTAPLTNVKMICTMDDSDSMKFISASGPANATPTDRKIIFPVVARIDAKNRVTYKITVRAEKEGQVQFKAEVSSDEITRPLIKVETTHFYK